MQGLRRADPSAGAGVPLLPLARYRRAGRLRQGDAGRLHGEPAVQPARDAGAVRDRAGRDRGRPAGPADHQHRGVPIPISSNSANRWRSSSSRSRTSGCRCSGRLRTPNRAPLPVDEIAPERFGEYVRPMLTTEKFEDKVALTGIGMSPIGRRLMQLPLSLTVQACEAAIADAGLTFADIDGLSTYPGAINRRRLRRGRGDRAGGRTGHSADVAQRRRWRRSGRAVR